MRDEPTKDALHLSVMNMIKGCVFSMVNRSEFHLGQDRDDDHGKTQPSLHDIF